jgi:hypothetical protein
MVSIKNDLNDKDDIKESNARIAELKLIKTPDADGSRAADIK